MNISNIEFLQSFRSVANRNILTEEVYEKLLKRWGLDKLDLNKEMLNIVSKSSNLSKTQRNAVPEFINLREILDSKKKQEQNVQFSMNGNTDNSLIQNTI